MKKTVLAGAALSLLFAACTSSPTAPQVPSGAIQVTGSVRHLALEGGLWAVQGDDGVIYDPLNGLSAEFRRENLRVTLVARVRSDLGGVHMVGPIVEVLSISER
jgi:hypothetical protein